MMPQDAEIGRSGLAITSDWLLLVEGKDEVNLFEELMKHCSAPNPQYR